MSVSAPAAPPTTKPARVDQPTMPSVAEAVDALMTRGFAVLPALMPEEDRRVASALHDEFIASGKATDSDGCFGYGIHPLCPQDGRFARFFAHPVITAVCAAMFSDEVSLLHTGSRVVDSRHARRGGRIGWHNHAFTPQGRAILPGDPSRGTKPERLLYGWYIDGSTPESGSLVAIPRRFDDPLAPPLADRTVAWPGEERILAPPGSAIIFTIDVWHDAISGSGDQRRRLMGAHVQARRNRNPHPEDHVFAGAEIEAAKRACPAFAALLPDGGQPLTR